MARRFVSIWFCHLITDWFTLRDPRLKRLPFVISTPSHGRMLISASNDLAVSQGIVPGMAVADARAIIPSLPVFDHKPELSHTLLNRIAEWCIRFTPFVSIDQPDSLILDVTGCSHLWGGEALYLAEINNRIRTRGYQVRAAIADTIGTAWAVAHFGKEPFVIAPGMHTEALLKLPPAALRLEAEIVERLHKLGLRNIEDFVSMPRPALRRRFGQNFLKKLDQALGYEKEILDLIHPVAPYQERLPCLEPIVTATGIEMALQKLLEALCARLFTEQKGLRFACLKCYRVDGKIEQVDIGTNRPSRNVNHLFHLFEIKLGSIEPALGIELFVLEARKVEDHSSAQEKLWQSNFGIDDVSVVELVDRLAGKFGSNQIRRYLPDEHYWPERSIKIASTLGEKPITAWRTDKPRPIQLLPEPERITVTAPIPDYPPMLFRYKEKLHKIIKADGPERIEQEWWLQEGEHRDYYIAEDEQGCRYWLFRSGHYDADKSHQWFIHGFFA